MILQTMTEYYNEQLATGNPLYAPPGMELKRIHFVLLINLDGVLIDVEQLQEKVSVAKSRQRGGKDAPLTANRMWDSLGYVTGYASDLQQQVSAKRQYRSFVDEVETLCRKFPENRSFRAVYRFYSQTEQIERLFQHPLWEKIASQKGHNLSFRLVGEAMLAAQQQELCQADDDTAKGHSTCLVSGKKANIQLKHPALYVPGGAGTGSKLIAFTKMCGYDSYYKHGGENAPVSVEVAESYAAALTGLLQQNSENNVVINKISFLYFTLPNTDFNRIFHSLLNPSVKTCREEVFTILKEYSHREEEFVLMAIIPNAARLSVRLFLRTTIGVVVKNIRQFYEEMELSLAYSNQEALSMMSPLFAASPQGDISRLAPQLVVDYLNAIVTAAPLPVTLQSELLDRIREKRKPGGITTSLLKCYLIRNQQNHIPMALDKENKNIGYLLGRTLAIVERAQELSTPGINYTIRDTYYHVISVTPSAVFNRLMGLSSAYFRKIASHGTAVFLKSQLSEVIGMLDDGKIPLRLSIDDQNCFALGYFHQRQTYFTKKERQDEQDNTKQI